MVWDTTQSALYTAVEKHNNEAERNLVHAPSAEAYDMREKSRGGKPSDAYNPQDGEHCDRSDIPRCPKGKDCGCCPKFGEKAAERRQSDPLEAILADKDALLIIALILVLLHEKADIKLIGALVLVLLG